MSNWARTSEYIDIDGVLLVGERDATGKPKRLVAMGNVTGANVTHQATRQQHKERQTGQRATDIDIETELTTGIAITLENASPDMLALSLRGDYSNVAAGSVTGEAIKAYNGVVPLGNLDVSSVVIKRGATTLTLYTNDSTPFDYKLNADAGSIQLNDGSVQPIAGLTTGGTAPTAISVGATTTVTVANTAGAGDYAWFSGFSGADAALINGKAHRIVSATPTAVVLALNTTGKTITLGTPLSCFEGQALTADYNYTAQTQVNALTAGSLERYLRLEGVNRARNNEPIVVDLFKFQVSPAQQFPILGDGQSQVASFVLEGSLLQDSLQASGSQYYKIRRPD